jgi:hypothetical protein
MPCVNASKYEILYMPKKYRKRLEALENAIWEQIGKEAFMFNPKKNGKFLKERMLFDLEELFEEERW